MYAIVDIETTGGFAGKNRITEVAIVVHDGENIVDKFETLVNPQQDIPGFITGLTGITQQMVEKAPTFKEVADKIHNLLKDKVFVAHNVHFDYSFIKRELELQGFSFSPKKACTVRLSRKIIPGLRSYGLGKLCEQLEIPIENRHRAAGDAHATALLFDILLRRNPEYIAQAIKKNSGETKLPPNLPKKVFLDLPEEAGVYYFHDAHGQIIYIGKAKNIKKRISGHFSGIAKDRRNQGIRNEIHDITYELTGNELIALLLESSEIKRVWPKYNRAQKFRADSWGIFQYQDREGFFRLNINKTVKGVVPLVTFHSHADAWQFLMEKVTEFELCPKLTGIQKSNGACFDHQYGNCKGACAGKETAEVYNDRLDEAINTFKPDEKSFAIIGEGRHLDEKSIILVENGEYLGFGFLENEQTIEHIDDIKPFITAYKSTAEIEHYIYSYVNNPLSRVLEF